MSTATSLAVHAPLPRRSNAYATRLFTDSPLSAIPPFVIGSEQTTNLCSSPRDVPARLLSPVRLAERRSRPPCSASPSPSCSTTKRRRASYLTRSAARARHCKLVDCSIIRGGPAIFDQLPWISLLNEDPSPDLLSPSIADLSLLPRARDSPVESGAGPIRSRKSSLRSAPFPTDLGTTVPSLSPSLYCDLPLLELPFSPEEGLPMDDDVLKTPPPRASVLPVDASFYNLMPITFADINAAEYWWPGELSSS